MSENKPSGLGLFLTQKKSSGGAGPAAGGASGVSNPKNVQKRWLMVGAGLVGLVVLSSTIFGDKSSAPTVTSRDKSPTMVSVTPPNADKEAFTSQFAKELESLKNEQERVKSLLAEKDKQIETLRPRAAEQLPPGVVGPPTLPGSNSGGLQSVGSSPPGPPIPVNRAPVSVPPVMGGNALPPMKGSGSDLPSLPVMPNGGGGEGAPIIFDAPSKDSSKTSSSSTGGPNATAKLSYRKNPNAGMLPAGAFAPVALLNGVDAGTSTATQNNPLPILMNITDQGTLPGAAQYKLKSCFVLGTAYGDLSAERVYGRFSRLSCVDKANKLVLSQEVQGYLVDSDGKLGMRGLIADRQGARLGKALLAGFAQGLTGALGSAQGATMQNATTGTTTSTVSGVSALRSAGLTGAQSATSQLAEFYLKEAQAIFPVITIDVGRTGTIVFTSTAQLNWSNGETQFVQQYTPTN